MSFIHRIGKKLLTGPGITGRSLKWCLEFYEAASGPVYAQRKHKEALLRRRSITHGLDKINRRWPTVKSTEQSAPVFILSAGWRSGSTLIQRLIMSHKSILVWGEPYSHARIISHLADSVSAITDTWPQDEWFIDHYDLNKISSTFVANMYPSIKDLQLACLSYMKILLEEPARQRGFQYWGLKDVRLTIEDARFIKWLFPKAKFVFLCRNPYNAYKSYRADRSWYQEWPDKPVFTARQFGLHWNSLVKGFYQGAAELEGLFLRYEDVLKSGSDFSALENYLDFELDAALLERKVGSHNRSTEALTKFESSQLRKEVLNMSKQLGYEA